MIGESRLPFVPIGDLQREARTAFKMKSGLPGGRSPRSKALWRLDACVVGSLHVWPGLCIPALRGPASSPARSAASFRMRGAGEGRGGTASRLAPPPQPSIGLEGGRPLPPPSHWSAPANDVPHWALRIWAPNSKILKVPAGAF